MGSDPLRKQRGASRGGTGDSAAPRGTRKRSGTSDSRAARARELHTQAAEADQTAAQYRAERDRLIHELRAEDPDRWSYAALARALGCSRELVALVLKRTR